MIGQRGTGDGILQATAHTYVSTYDGILQATAHTYVSTYDGILQATAHTNMSVLVMAYCKLLHTQMSVLMMAYCKLPRAHTHTHTHTYSITHCDLIRRYVQIPAFFELQICPTFHRHPDNLAIWVNHTKSSDVGATILVWF